LDALNGKEGSYRLGEISRWSRIPRATCDRYLKQMKALGLLTESKGVYASNPCRNFAITENGHALIQVYQV
jgi:Fic family protein